VPVTDSPAGDITTLKPTYIWSRISDANTYKLVVHNVAGAVDVIDLTVSKSYCSTTTNLCKYTPSTYLSLDKAYHWKVMAINAAGLPSAFSGTVSFKPVRPTTPTTFTPTGNITVTKPPYVWSRVSAATSYKLYIIDVLSAKTILTATVSSSYCSTDTSRCTYTPSTTLTRNKDYQWKVEAVSAGGLPSLPSGTVNFRVIY
ncbi:MAG: hypothetical protein HGA86_02190, partial [Anaerolineaceae bacterium]|nr:hypothetical protein [Anaerolineaceae bacterium]